MQSIDNTRTVVESSVNARLEDQTANLNRCLFFITPLISYATFPSSPRSPLPPFYSEFRLYCRELDYTCVCACTLVMHTCLHPCLFVYLVSVSIRSSLYREFVKASSLPSCFHPFLRRLYHPILFSLNVLLSGDASKVTGARVPVARCRIPTGPIHPWGSLPTNQVASVERHAHTYINTAVPPANYFCLASLKITTFQVREKEDKGTISPDENYL